MPKKFKSPALAALHESIEGLHVIGLVDDKIMRRFDNSCLAPENKDVPLNEKELYEVLASQGIRIFMLTIRPGYRMTYIHPAKTTTEWRSDVRRIIAEIAEENKNKQHSDNIVFNSLLSKMAGAGYMEVDDLASDVYEGALDASECVKDSPIHSDQADGFGHHGWES